MDDQGCGRITVQIDSAEPLRGTITQRGRADRHFSGWTAFGTLMDEVVRELFVGDAPQISDVTPPL